MARLLGHTHLWTYYEGSGFGNAIRLRHCDSCDTYETQLYDIHLKEVVWVAGNFFEDITSPIFIIAEEKEAVEEIVQQLPKKTIYSQAKDDHDLAVMKHWTHPRFLLASDWKETSISDIPEFRKLMETGHF